MATDTKKELHAVSSVAQEGPNSQLYRVSCMCGASWTINKQEKDAFEFKIDWHIQYANRPKTRVD